MKTGQVESVKYKVESKTSAKPFINEKKIDSNTNSSSI
jgi:hypothetical protein